jgi:hypothetical protein
MTPEQVQLVRLSFVSVMNIKREAGRLFYDRLFAIAPEVRPKLKVGICGEHGGDPASVAFCHEAKLDYVSCSPFRVPIARLAAAQAALGKDVASQA